MKSEDRILSVKDGCHSSVSSNGGAKMIYRVSYSESL